MYYIDSNGLVYDEVGVIAPDGNPMWQKYLEWLAEGNEPEPWTVFE